MGVSRQSAYRLRQRSTPFRIAWDDALDLAMSCLEEAALSRALHGVPRPIFYKGEQVGEARDYDERLTMFLLRSRRPQRFGKWVDRLLAPEDANHDCDLGARLAGDLDAIEFSDACEAGLIGDDE